MRHGVLRVPRELRERAPVDSKASMAPAWAGGFLDRAITPSESALGRPPALVTVCALPPLSLRQLGKLGPSLRRGSARQTCRAGYLREDVGRPGTRRAPYLPGSILQIT